jgi:hypothetical protein
MFNGSYVIHVRTSRVIKPNPDNEVMDRAGMFTCHQISLPSFQGVFSLDEATSFE